MFVDHLQLVDFRSYGGVDVPLGPGVTIFVGANGQGKTNLVEAVEYLSTLGSHRVATEAPLVRAGAEQGLLRARVQAGLDDQRSLQLEIQITPGKANKARLNRSPLPRARELVGLLRTVVFSPEDLAIVKGDPSERRRFIDTLIISRWPRLAGVKADYDRVLRQRNTLLKSLAGRSAGGRRTEVIAEAATTLDVWDSHLAQAGAALLRARLRTLSELQPLAGKAYVEIAPTNNLIAAEYVTSIEYDDSEGLPEEDVLRQALLDKLTERRPDELQRGISLAGPHRDDILFTIGELPARGYASHGESWSLALALRLGSFALLRSDGIEPVLVLDDVFAELDATRRDRLAGQITEAEQVLITAAVAEDVPEQLGGRRYRVASGEVTEDGADG
ncbi:DNA replication and repair protein RecF [Microlunatus endophyticus]|uniref:DNA replication and repair protein RecF n=1 Tax=Microlunatus endophyticus TaxID=1716077 RepID=A0A917SDK5_9ACTN|nr:DNA replication/repair protein RecF [Microlunatus endophyticus]GGL70696.1 DNA replication and repair protein RecF [Microlunatus endophyticus]